MERTLSIVGSVCSVVTATAWAFEKLPAEAAIPLIAAGALPFLWGAGRYVVKWFMFELEDMPVAPPDVEPHSGGRAQPLAFAQLFRARDGSWPPVPPVESTSRGQTLYRDAIEMLASGGIDLPGGRQVGAILLDWISWQYHDYVQRYPGAAGEANKLRYYERAFERLKQGKILSGRDQASTDALANIVETIGSYVTRRFLHEH